MERTESSLMINETLNHDFIELERNDSTFFSSSRNFLGRQYAHVNLTTLPTKLEALSTANPGGFTFPFSLKVIVGTCTCQCFMHNDMLPKEYGKIISDDINSAIQN